MSAPDLTRDEQYTKADIETLFDTGFGYQISGINPRRDNNDNRYILLFATEDGPYSDSIRSESFEYIGEGLEGDQSASSPGNAVLIDAVETQVPIHFFHKPTDADAWTYRGLVDVQNYDYVERGGRQVFVFTLSYRNETGASQTRDASEPPYNAMFPLPGGVTAYVDTLRRILTYVDAETPTTDELRQWMLDEFDLSSTTYVDRGLTFIRKVGLLDTTAGQVVPGTHGQTFLETDDVQVVYDCIREQAVAFEWVLEQLAADTQSVEQLNAALLDTFDAPEWDEPHQTQFRVNWLRSLGYVERTSSGYTATAAGEAVLAEATNAAPSTPPGLYLIPISDDWWARFQRTVASQYTPTTDAVQHALGSDPVRVWGTTATDSAKKQQAIDAMRAGDWLLFYHNGDFVAQGRVDTVVHDAALGDAIWDSPDSTHVFTVTEYSETPPSIGRVWDWLGYEGRQVVQGFTRVADERVAELRAVHGSLAAVFAGDAEPEPTAEQIEAARETLEAHLDEEPPDSVPVEYTTVQQAAREAAFRQAVREAYDERCAVCGVHRETPDGRPEVEAAHLKAKADGGPDDIRNGIALCKLHHWAFDNGWFAITDDYEVVVTDAAEQAGYTEFAALDERRLQLPDDSRKQPAAKYLD